MTSWLRIGDVVRLRNSRGCTYTVTHVYPTYWNEKESVIVKSNNSGYAQKRRKAEDYVLIRGVNEMRDIKKNDKTFLEHGWKPGDVVRLINRGSNILYDNIKLYEEHTINPSGLISIGYREFAGFGRGSEWERVKKANKTKKYVVALKGTYYITETIPPNASEVYELGRKLSKKEEWV